MKRIIILSGLLFGLASFVHAQDMIFTLNYNWGHATGDFEEFTPDPAYRGGGLKYTKFLETNENVGIGMFIDWQGWYTKTERSTFPIYDETTHQSNSDINGLQFRYQYATPVMLSFDYYFLKDETILPYIGISAGAMYTEQELNVSAVSNRIITDWDFAVGASAGFHLAFGESGVGLNVTGKYYYSWYNNTFYNVMFTTNKGSYVSLGVGLSFLMMRY